MKDFTQIVRLVRHSLKEKEARADGEIHISPEGIALAQKHAPIILDGFPSSFCFPTYVGPLVRCTETAREGLGVKFSVIVEDLFHITDLAMEVITTNMDQIKITAKEENCTGVAAILKIRDVPAISKMLENMRWRVQRGIVKICRKDPIENRILVVSHSPVIDSAVDDYATGGLKELDWVDFHVEKEKIVDTVVCHHVAINS